MRRGVLQGIEQFQEQDQALQTVGGADGFHQARSLQRGVASEFQPAAGMLEQRLQVTELWQGCAQGEEGGAVELQYHIAAGQVIARRQFADPVVGQVRADEATCPALNAPM